MVNLRPYVQATGLIFWTGVFLCVTVHSQIGTFHKSHLPSKLEVLFNVCSIVANTLRTLFLRFVSQGLIGMLVQG
jgi:hypothetical protein